MFLNRFGKSLRKAPSPRRLTPKLQLELLESRVVLSDGMNYHFDQITTPVVIPSLAYPALPHDITVNDIEPGGSLTVNADAHDVTITDDVEFMGALTLNGNIHNLDIQHNIDFGATVTLNKDADDVKLGLKFKGGVQSGGTFTDNGNADNVSIYAIYGSVTIGKSNNSTSIHDLKVGDIFDSGPPPASLTVNGTANNVTLGFIGNGTASDSVTLNNTANITLKGVEPMASFTVNGSAKDVTITDDVEFMGTVTMKGNVHNFEIDHNIDFGSTVTLNKDANDVTLGQKFKGGVQSGGTFTLMGSAHNVTIYAIYGTVTLGSSSTTTVDKLKTGDIFDAPGGPMAMLTVNGTLNDGDVGHISNATVHLHKIGHEFKTESVVGPFIGGTATTTNPDTGMPPGTLMLDNPADASKVHTD
jgi:hypothetical protein